jgi:transposase
MLSMTLHRRDLAEIPADIAAVGQKLLPPTNPYRVIGDHLADILDDAHFAALYAPTGRAALSPALLALVTLFQFMENIPDREAAEQVVVRLDWKYALHLPVTDAGVDFSCLCYFRRRLLAHAQERLVFEQILGKIQALGFVKKRGKQRTDSLAVLGAVRQLSALETVTETLRLAVRALAQADPTWVAQEVPASFVQAYAHNRSDYRLSADERKAALQQVGQDGVWLLERLEATAPAALRDLEAVQVLRTVWEQRYERSEGRVRVRAKTVDCTELIVTPPDPGVRAAEKRGTKWRGDKVHVTETAEADAPHFLTDVTTAAAPSVDSAALPRIRQRLAERALPPGEQYVDAGYVSGPQLAQSQEAGIELVGPALPDTTPNQLKIADFTIDRAAKRAICPQGHASVKWGVSTEPDGSQSVHIQFTAAVCAVCPLRAQCTTGKSGRSLRLSEHYELVAARRLEAQTEEFQERMRARPAIEATLSELVRKHGLRRHRYRGEAKRAFENLLKGAACNLKRLVRALVARWERDAAASALALGRGSRVAALPLAA